MPHILVWYMHQARSSFADVQVQSLMKGEQNLPQQGEPAKLVRQHYQRRVATDFFESTSFRSLYIQIKKQTFNWLQSSVLLAMFLLISYTQLFANGLTVLHNFKSSLHCSAAMYRSAGWQLASLDDLSGLKLVGGHTTEKFCAMIANRAHFIIWSKDFEAILYSWWLNIVPNSVSHAECHRMPLSESRLA